MAGTSPHHCPSRGDEQASLMRRAPSATPRDEAGIYPPPARPLCLGSRARRVSAPAALPASGSSGSRRMLRKPSTQRSSGGGWPMAAAAAAGRGGSGGPGRRREHRAAASAFMSGRGRPLGTAGTARRLRRPPPAPSPRGLRCAAPGSRRSGLGGRRLGRGNWCPWPLLGPTALQELRGTGGPLLPYSSLPLALPGGGCCENQP